MEMVHGEVTFVKIPGVAVDVVNKNGLHSTRHNISPKLFFFVTEQYISLFFSCFPIFALSLS